MAHKPIDEVLAERGLMARFYDALNDTHVYVSGGGAKIELPASTYVRTFRIPEMRYGEVATMDEVRAARG